MRTKRFYANQIISVLQNSRPNIDFKIDEREVFARMDQVVNERAVTNFFENWVMSGSSVDEHYLTRWDGDTAIEVTDPGNGKPSFLIIPATYSDLPWHRGIDEIWPINYGKSNQSVVIMSHRDIRRMQNNKAFNLQGRLGGYPSGSTFYFNRPDVARVYGKKFGVSLMIRDSSMISIDAPYPIPTNFENIMVEECTKWFLGKRAQPADKIRDNQDQP